MLFAVYLQDFEGSADDEIEGSGVGDGSEGDDDDTDGSACKLIMLGMCLLLEDLG